MTKKENLESRVLVNMFRDPTFYDELFYGTCSVATGIYSVLSLISIPKDPLYFPTAAVFAVASLFSWKKAESYREYRNRM